MGSEMSIRARCHVKPADRRSTDSLSDSLKISKLESAIMIRRMRLFGHVHRSESWINKCTSVEVTGKRGKGRPRKTWQETVNSDLNTLNVDEGMTLDRVRWRQTISKAIGSPTHIDVEKRTLNGQ